MKIFKILILLPNIIYTFDTESFLRKYCRENHRNHLTCSNFNLSRKDIQGIQDQDFTISMSSVILFQNVNIRSLNVNFFNKFPNAIEIYFVDSILRLTQSYKKTRYEDPVLQKLSFSTCTLLNNKETNAFKYLYNLKEFYILQSTFESGSLDPKFLEEKSNLIVLEISSADLNVYLNSFYNLRNLSFVSLRNLKSTYFPQYLFKDNQKIVYLDLSGNLLRKIPSESLLPGSLQYLNLDDNEISDILQSDFQDIESLKHLYLDGNKISSLGENLFLRIQRLEYLSLARNRIRRISLDYFSYLKNLKRLEIHGNYIDDWSTLERLPANETRIYPQNEWLESMEDSFNLYE